MRIGEMKVSRTKTKYMCLNGEVRESINMQNCRLPEVTEFKYLGSTMQNDEVTEAKVNKIQSGWKKLEEDVRSPL